MARWRSTCASCGATFADPPSCPPNTWSRNSQESRLHHLLAWPIAAAIRRRLFPGALDVVDDEVAKFRRDRERLAHPVADVRAGLVTRHELHHLRRILGIFLVVVQL